MNINGTVLAPHGLVPRGDADVQAPRPLIAAGDSVFRTSGPLQSPPRPGGLELSLKDGQRSSPRATSR